MSFVEIRDVKTHFPIRKGAFVEKMVATVKAVDGVSLSINKGEVLGLVGESGCGKSTLGRTIIRLIEPTAGEIIIDGKNISNMTSRELHRGRLDFQMIFQDPYSSLNPRFTVFDTLAEPLIFHNIVPKNEVTKEVSRLMEVVGLAPRFMKKYPHEFSGGQRQRIAIARALAVKPKLIIADEPVSALDVSIQAQILNLLRQLQKQFNLTMIFIAHDLGVVKHISDRIAVMYLGKIVEIGPSNDIYLNPMHPYSQALIASIPVPDPRAEQNKRQIEVLGEPPSPINPPKGCSFNPRCPFAFEKCRQTMPVLTSHGNRKAACFKLDQ